MSDTTIRGNATRRGPDAKRFAFFMPGPPRQLLKIFTCYLWGTHASRTKRGAGATSVDTPPLPSPAPPARAYSPPPFSRARKPLFRLFSFDCLPFFCFRRSAGSGVFLRRCSLTSFIRSRGNPSDPPATSREFYKTFHASLTASAFFLPTKQRILVWIEFLMEPTPPGPSTQLPPPPPPPLLSSPSRDVRRYSCIESRAKAMEGVATISSRYSDFLRARDTCVRMKPATVKVASEEMRKSGDARIACVKSKGKKKKRTSATVIPRQRRAEWCARRTCIAMRKKKLLSSILSGVILHTTTPIAPPHSYCNIILSTYARYVCPNMHDFFPRKHFIKRRAYFSSFFIIQHRLRKYTQHFSARLLNVRALGGICAKCSLISQAIRARAILSPLISP